MYAHRMNPLPSNGLLRDLMLSPLAPPMDQNVHFAYMITCDSVDLVFSLAWVPMQMSSSSLGHWLKTLGTIALISRMNPSDRQKES